MLSALKQCFRLQSRKHSWIQRLITRKAELCFRLMAITVLLSVRWEQGDWMLYLQEQREDCDGNTRDAKAEYAADECNAVFYIYIYIRRHILRDGPAKLDDNESHPCIPNGLENDASTTATSASRPCRPSLLPSLRPRTTRAASSRCPCTGRERARRCWRAGSAAQAQVGVQHDGGGEPSTATVTAAPELASASVTAVGAK